MKYIVLSDSFEAFGSFSSQGKALDAATTVATNSKPKLEKGEKYAVNMEMDAAGNLTVVGTANTADKKRLIVSLRIVELQSVKK
jgi:hypothetical protein